MNNLYLSIIIPVYNGEKYVLTTLDSIGENILDGVEVIIVDDASKDATVSLIEEWLELHSGIRSHFKVIAKSQNQGVSLARNEGIRESSGEWLMFVDADDLLKKGSLKEIGKMIDGIQEDLIYTPVDVRVDPIVFDFEGFDKLEFFEDGRALYSNYRVRFDQRTIDVCTGWLYRRSFILTNDLYFTAGMIMLEDAEFLGRVCSIAGSCRLSDIGFYIYRLHSESTSAQTKIFEIPALEGHIRGVKSLREFSVQQYGVPNDAFLQGLIIKFSLLPYQACIGKWGVDWQKHKWVDAQMREFGYVPIALNSGNLHLVHWAKILNISIYLYYFRWWLRLLWMSLGYQFRIRRNFIDKLHFVCHRI